MSKCFGAQGNLINKHFEGLDKFSLRCQWMDCGEVRRRHIRMVDVFLPSLNSMKAGIISASSTQKRWFFILFLREIGISQVEKEGEHSIQKANLKQRPWSMRVCYVWRLMSY